MHFDLSLKNGIFLQKTKIVRVTMKFKSGDTLDGKLTTNICTSGDEGGEGVHMGSSFCGTPAKKLQNLRPAACKVITLRLRHHQDSQVAIKIDSRS